MALRDRLNQYAKRAGNSLYSGLGDVLTTEINPKYLLSAAVLAGSLAFNGMSYAEESKSKNIPVVKIDNGMIPSSEGHCEMHENVPIVILRAYHNNGVKALEYTCKKGKPEGIQYGWHDNGQKNIEWNYVNGKAEGKHNKWYKNGKKEYEDNFVNDEREGKQVTWYENGQKQREQYFVNGKEEGKQQDWYDNGQKEKEWDAVKGRKEGRLCEWDSSGKLIREKLCKKDKCETTLGVCKAK